MTVFFRLDGIDFKDFALPEKMGVGGEQQLVIHKMIGGKQVIDAMGPDDAPLEWSGTFLDETAEMRVLQLDLMRRSGREVQLSFASRQYRAVVSKFSANMERPYLWTYSISLEIIEDLVAGDGGPDSTNAEQQVAADLAAAEDFAAARDKTLYSVAVASTAVRAAMGDPAARRAIGSIAMAEAQGYLSDAILEAGGSVQAANLALSAVAGVGGVAMGGDPAAMAINFLGTAASMEVGYSGTLVAAHLNRVRTNMAEVS